MAIDLCRTRAVAALTAADAAILAGFSYDVVPMLNAVRGREPAASR